MPDQISYLEVDSGDWQWAETYIYAMAIYTVACPAYRRIQVGMGIMEFGEPRGEKIRFSGEKEITVIGAGALYFRVDDGLGPCKVGFVQGKATLIGSHWDF
ncbi:hypothetical protein [Pseudomonas aeruginosa]|uniref:hypothetical protein n=1 Tax=Pseudomonas aeruginosa TaxID=287 RepID=UPI00155E1B6B|nr:hypothetical protein [Pseudomonas aeruginosa]NRC33950.1 hypothetical protein [Pseudomonas aeruginosa]